jgi:hypothetical protein
MYIITFVILELSKTSASQTALFFNIAFHNKTSIILHPCGCDLFLGIGEIPCYLCTVFHDKTSYLKTSQKKKHLSPSTRRRNAQRMDQWKAKREAVGNNTTCVQTQTADINPSTDETMQTDQHNSDAQAINKHGFE